MAFFNVHVFDQKRKCPICDKLEILKHVVALLCLIYRGQPYSIGNTCLLCISWNSFIDRNLPRVGSYLCQPVSGLQIRWWPHCRSAVRCRSTEWHDVRRQGLVTSLNYLRKAVSPRQKIHSPCQVFCPQPSPRFSYSTCIRIRAADSSQISS